MQPNQFPAGTHSRRHAVKVGAGLLVTPALLAAGPVFGEAASDSTSRQPMTPPNQNNQGSTPGLTLQNPLEKYPKPPFNKQEQEWPGLQSKMDPRPDCGEKSYKGSGRLAGRKALVTGGDSGIGRAAVIAFAREGADVAINYLPAEELDAREVVELVQAAGRKCVALPGDIRDEQFCNKLVDDAFNSLGGLDILINNAGRQQAKKSIDELTSDEFDATMKTNLYALFWITKAALAHMSPGSAIINTASIQAFDPSPDIFHYAMTKAAIANCSEGLAKQLGPRGIRVNAVAPGPVWTPLQVSGGQFQDKLVKFGEDSPLGRPGEPAELAPIFVLLASSEASYSSGEVYGVTGGKPLV